MAGNSALHIAVCDRASSYRRGLGATLEAAGYVVLDVDDVRSRADVNGVDLLLFTVRSAGDWQVIRDVLTVNPGMKLVALLVEATAELHAEAIRCGAHAAVAWEATPETIRAVVAAAVEGRTLLPTEIAQSIAASGPALYDPEWITAEEISWLKTLAAGATMEQLAEKVGYSERALYRMLHGLYHRMRVSNRTEALLQASRWGLLDD